MIFLPNSPAGWSMAAEVLLGVGRLERRASACGPDRESLAGRYSSGVADASECAAEAGE